MSELDELRAEVAALRAELARARTGGITPEGEVPTASDEPRHRRREEHLGAVFEYAPLALFGWDHAGACSSAAGRGLAAMGVDPERAAGRPISELLGHSTAAGAALRRALAGESASFSAPVGAGTFDVYLRPTERSEGGVYAGVGVAVDVTERALAEQALSAHDARFRAVIERSSELVALVGADGSMKYVSPAAERLLGYTREEQLATDAFHWLHPDDLENVLRSFGELLASPGRSVRVETRARHRDGTQRWIEAVGTNLLDDAAVAAVVVIARDVTERRRAEEARSRLAEIVESSSEAIVSAALDGTIETWNPAAERLFGYTAAEAVGQNVRMLVPPGRVDELTELEHSVARGERITAVESVRRRKDGQLVEVALTLSPIRDWSGRTVGVSRIGHDLTERRRAEAALRKSAERLLEAQKMEAVGRLAGGIAHDFNNLLTIILSCAELVLDELAADDAQRADLEEIRRAATRANELTTQLLAFSRQQVIQPRTLDLGQSVAALAPVLQRLLSDGIELAIDARAGEGVVYVDPGQLELVVLNLAVNAREAMPTGGVLRIETAAVDLDAAAAGEQGVSPGAYVVLRVRDSGHGMDPATQARIFEPFFSTKKARGAGLGLSTVFGIVQQAGGFISVQSEPGRGSTFGVFFPRAAGADRRATQRVGRAALRGTERVLLVEDEDALRAVARTILRRAGYTVVDFPGGPEALAYLAEGGAAVDLLLTDVVMPKMGGRELATHVRAARPAIRVLYMSGYTGDAFVRHGELEADVAFLQKPFTPDGLLRKVREVLDVLDAPPPR